MIHPVNPNPRDIVREILARTPAPPSPPRTPHGGWLSYAEAVHTLVANHGWGVTDSVRHVVSVSGLEDNPKARTGIRAAYYAFAAKNPPSR